MAVARSSVRTQPDTGRAKASVSAVRGASWPRCCGGMLADNVDYRRARLARVVEVRQRVRQARSQVQQGGRRLSGHAGIPVRRAGTDALEQAQDAAHARHAVERRDKLHLGSSRIHQAQIHFVGQQGSEETLGAIHVGFSLSQHTAPLWQRPCGTDDRFLSSVNSRALLAPDRPQTPMDRGRSQHLYCRAGCRGAWPGLLEPGNPSPLTGYFFSMVF